MWAFVIVTFQSNAQSWAMKPGSVLEFKIDGPLGIDVNGTMSISIARIEFNPADISGANFSGEVDVATVNTKNKKRDKHLAGADYFDAVRFPKIFFQSEKLVISGQTSYIIYGKLTIKGVSLPVALPVVIDINNGMANISMSCSLNRLDYKVGGKSMLMGEKVRVQLNTSLRKVEW